VKLNKLPTWHQLLAMAIVAVMAGAPVACSEMSGSPSAQRVDCHKSRGNLEC